MEQAGREMGLGGVEDRLKAGTYEVGAEGEEGPSKGVDQGRGGSVGACRNSPLVGPGKGRAGGGEGTTEGEGTAARGRHAR